MSSSINRSAYADWCVFVQKQGWNEDSQLNWLEDYLRHKELMADFLLYVRERHVQEDTESGD